MRKNLEYGETVLGDHDGLAVDHARAHRQTVRRVLPHLTAEDLKELGVTAPQ